MGVHVILILTGIIGASVARNVNSDIWSVDTEPTDKMNLNGMIFFYEKQHTDTTSQEERPQNKQTLTGDPKPLNAFSHFMPDQSKLSLAAGLSRIARRKSRKNMDAIAGSENDLLNFAPKGDVETPFTSEVIGFDSRNNKLSETGSKRDSFTGNDVMSNDNSQLINFSQLGIMKDNLGDVISSVSEVKEINYLNTGTNAFAANNKLDSSEKMRTNLFTDTTGSGNMFDKATGAVEKGFVPDLNNNGYIFDNAFTPAEITKADDSAQVANNLMSRVLRKESIEPLGSTSQMSSSSFTKRISSDGNAFNNFKSTIADNAFESSKARKDIVKPFPFGQLQGKPAKINKRVPTFKTQNDFVDHSRKPILTVKTAFVDMSGRQNPKLKAFGTFIDTSNETSNTAIQSTVKPTTPPIPTTTTSFISSIKTNPTVLSPQPTRPNPMLSGIGLPGVVGVNPTQTNQNGIPGGNSKTGNNINTGSNTITSQGVTDTKSGNSAKILPTREAPKGNLNVDILYPPAPFPSTDQTNTISSIDQTGINKPSVNTPDVTVNKEQASVNNKEADNTATSNAVSVNKNGVAVGELDYDYDMYADVSNDVNQNRNIPLNNNGEIDRFITDPNVQIINPSNQIVPDNVQINPNGLNAIKSQAGTQDIGRLNNFQNNSPNIGSDERLTPINSNSLQNNGQVVQNNINNRQMNDQTILNNGKATVNNQFNRNQVINGQGMQGATNTLVTRGDNGQSRPGNNWNNQNILNQYVVNSNIPNRFQQNLNSFPNGRIASNINSLQNDIANRNIGRKVSPGLIAGQNNPIINTAVLNGQNEILQQNQQRIGGQNDGSLSRQRNINNIPTGVRIPDLSANNLNGAVNAQNNMVNQNRNQRVPTQIQTGSQSIERNINNPNILSGAVNAQTNMVNQNRNQREPPQIQTGSQSIGRNINNPNNIPMNPSQGQNVQSFNGQINAVQTRNVGMSVPNVNLANSIGNRASVNGINIQNQRTSNNLNVNSGGRNGNLGQNNINIPNNNFQNGPIVSNNNNGQIPRLNNVQNSLNNFPRNINGQGNSEITGQNLQTRFQTQNNFINSQTLGNQRNVPNFGNGIQRIGQNNVNRLPNSQFFNPGNFPNNIPNVPTFQGNVPQFQNNLPNNILSGNFRNGLNNFGSNMAFNVPGVNRFPGNLPPNTNPFGPNAINRQFGSFR